MRLHVLAMSFWAVSFFSVAHLDAAYGSTLCDVHNHSRCQCSLDRREVECRKIGINNFTSDSFPITTVKLNLDGNNLTQVNEDIFSKLTGLEELLLGDNKLQIIDANAFVNNNQLKRLSLQNCHLLRVPSQSLSSLRSLTSLQLDKNEIQEIEDDSFKNLIHLRSLKLESNRLRSIPIGALHHLKSLEALNLGNNMITTIPGEAFSNLQNLFILLLKKNQISIIEDNAFVNLTSLRVLELDSNLLTHLPIALRELVSLQELSISNNKIKYIPEGILQKSPELGLIELQGNPLVGIDPNAFSFLPNLQKLTLSEARELSEFPNLNGTTYLEILRLDRASLRYVPTSLCKNCPRLRSLDLKWNKLTQVPNLNLCKDLRVLDLAHNRIAAVDGKPFKGLSQLHDLLLSHNMITRIPNDAFFGLGKLQVLDLEENLIENIHPNAFANFKQLEDLNLGNNVFPNLPTNGLNKLLHLKTFNNPNLKNFPRPYNFPRIQTLVLSYAYHCCSFLPLIPLEQPKLSVHESVLFPTDTEFDMSLWNSSLTDIWPQLQNLSKKFGTEINELWESFGSDFTYPGNLPAYVEEYFEEQEAKLGPSEHITGKIQCLPLPGPFLPCQDLFDWWTLRCGVWIVFLLAMLGNGTVVFVLIFSRSKMDVPRFLVCNLAAADFFMGIYLGFLAVVDASTLGEFRMYAIPWQMSVGCQLAGFLGVLSSELSVYTLAVITLERNYAITHAMHLNKRLSLKHAGYIMACGWSFALIMSLFPLFGISDYRKFAICLPFETETPGSLTYVVFLMLINGVAFFILMGCYLKMYCAIRGSQAWNSNDSRIAKRMALLVFTDFLCWSPIAFFSLTAAFGVQLVSLEQAKVFTVFVLPLNSCCNPFLYAILTKQFKKDCILICKTIEESKVTRGIGRCRHSSNFSNRQTPINTNSLVDRSSKDNQHSHQQHCNCTAKLLTESTSGTMRRANSTSNRRGPRRYIDNTIHWLLLCLSRRTESNRHSHSDQYAYQIAEIQQKTHKRASSVSSSENFSSSRSDSWRQNHHHHCGIPLRLLDPKRRANSWLVTRKTSQDSNLSSSRNDSSGSATTQSTSTWRMSRSSASSDVRTQIVPSADVNSNRAKPKPRLTRQSAVSDDYEFNVSPGSPGRLTVRFLSTIPSAAETSMQNEEEIPHDSSSSDNRALSPEDFFSKISETNPSYASEILTRHRQPASPYKSLKPSNEVLTEPSASNPSHVLVQVPTSLSEKNGLPSIRSAPSLASAVGLSSSLVSPDKNTTKRK